MIVKILLAIAAIGVIGFFVKAKDLSKVEYHELKDYIAAGIFFVVAIVPMLYILFFA